MKTRITLFVLCIFAAPLIAHAQEPTPDPNQFSDPAISFTAPAGYYKLPVPSHSPVEFDQPTVVAGWVHNPGKRDQFTIMLTMENNGADAKGFAGVEQSELRNQLDGVFFKANEPATLSNGMPAYWQDITIGSGFDTIKRYQYVWGDGVRGVVLSITGAYGQLDEKTAKAALSNVSAVLFPRGRL